MILPCAVRYECVVASRPLATAEGGEAIRRPHLAEIGLLDDKLLPRLRGRCFRSLQRISGLFQDFPETA
jgi:hypothetical protein